MRNQIKHFCVLIILTLLVTMTSHAQNSKKILRKYKKGSDTHMITIPGFVAKIAINAYDTDKEVKQALKKVKSVRLFISERVDEGEFKKMSSDLSLMFKKNDYKPLIEIKSDGDLVQIQFLPGTQKHRGEFVVLARSENDFVAVILEGKFTEKDVRKIAKNIDVENL